MLQLKFSPFPNLDAKRVSLRQLRREDIPQLYALRSNAQVMKYIAREPLTDIIAAETTFKRVTTGIENNEWILWGLVPHSENKVLGTVCLWNIAIEHHRAEIGYDLLPEYQGKGLMAEALVEVIKYGFNVLKLHSIEAQVNPLNNASIKLIERSGFLREAYLRENYFYEGQYRDTAIYSLLANQAI